MNTALILVDIQNDYFHEGKMPLSGSIEASKRAEEVLTRFRERKLPVVHIRHVSTRSGSTFFLPGTPGAEIHEHVRPLPGETVITKEFPNSFRGTPLMSQLIGLHVGRLVVCGMMTHMCIDATVRAAFDHGFSCTVIGDACATKSLEFSGTQIPAAQVHAAFLAALNGIYAQVINGHELKVSS